MLKKYIYLQLFTCLERKKSVTELRQCNYRMRQFGTRRLIDVTSLVKVYAYLPFLIIWMYTSKSTPYDQYLIRYYEKKAFAL